MRKGIRWQTAVYLGLFLIIYGGVGCASPQEASHESLLSELEHHSETESVPVNIEHLLLEYVTVDVDAETAVSFQTVAHTNDLVKYPCTTCHESSLDELDTEAEPHWDITLEHAPPDVMNCTTCHDPQNLDSLHSVTEQPIEFDHSYQLCAQCHSPQFEDWVGGAHGKRLGGWAPPRVVETCVGCHNPHKPAWETRWPAVTGGGIQE